MPKHTPGPWKLGGWISDYGEVVRGPSDEYICRVGQNLHEKRANTSLIEAAPDLLQALTAILSHPRTDDSSIVFMPREIAAARAAIAKAKGE